MSIAALTYVKEGLEALGINYEYGSWSSDIVYPYFVGTSAEAVTDSESGMTETQLTLDGFTRGSKLELLQAKEIIENNYKRTKTAILSNGVGVAVFYNNSLDNIPTGDMELKRLQIFLTIKEWSVN